MFDFVLTAVPSICATYSLDSVGDVPGEIPPPFQPGWSPPPPPPALTVTSIVVEEVGAPEYRVIVNFSQIVVSFDPSAVAPLWTATDNDGPVTFFGFSHTPGDDWIELHFNTVDPVPFTLTIPPGADQVLGINGAFVTPGVYVDPS